MPVGHDLCGGSFPAAVERTPLVSDAVTDIPALSFSNWIHYECSMGTRQGRYLRLVVYSTRQGDAGSFMTLSLSHSPGVIKHTADVSIALWWVM